MKHLYGIGYQTSPCRVVDRFMKARQRFDRFVERVKQTCHLNNIYTKTMKIELYTFELYMQDLDKSRGSYSIRVFR